MRFNSDIDIDFSDRAEILKHIDVIPASIRKDKDVKRHNTGVHPTEIPYDPENDVSAINYTEAENRGYIKLDLLNVWVYKLVRDEEHLIELMQEPQWNKLSDPEYFEKLIHIGKHYSTMQIMSEPINSIPRLAMFLAIIRPGKKHLIGKTWSEVAKTVWDKDSSDYTFKRSHSVAYANLVIVNMNLLTEYHDRTGRYDIGSEK